MVRRSSEGLGSGVWVRRGGVMGLRTAKSQRSRPRGRVGGQVRWRFGVEGMVCVMFS